MDRACTRDLGLVVTGPDGYFSEEKRHAQHLIEPIENGVPAYCLTSIAVDGAYRIEKRVLTDPMRPSVLQDIVFTPLKGDLVEYRVYALLSPHLFNCGMGNTAWIGDYKGTQMLFATGRDGGSLALASSLPWPSSSAGYVGVSDGWRQLQHQGMLDPGQLRAHDGNVSLTGEIGFSLENDRTLLSLGFAGEPEEAGYNALASLMAGFDAAAKPYVSGWRNWQSHLQPLDRIAASGRNVYRISTAVLAAHRSAAFPGPVVASLSIPWGFNKGDDDLADRELLRGGPTGSAMPLVWAHAEYIKLLRSLRDGAVFDMPPQGPKRYIADKTGSALRAWRFNNKIRSMAAGKVLRLELPAPAMVHWSTDGWATSHDDATRANDFAIHLLDLPVADLKPGHTIVFTFFWSDGGNWENIDFSVVVGPPDMP